MEKINIEQIRTKYHYYTPTTNGSLESKGDDTESSLKIIANKINEIIDILTLCKETNDTQMIQAQQSLKNVLGDCKPKIPDPWVLQEGGEYFYFEHNGIIKSVKFDEHDCADNYRLKTNNVFKTYENARVAYKKIMSL